MKIAAAALIALVAATPALAQPKRMSSPPKEQCLLHNRIENTVVADNSTINIRDWQKQYWQVKMAFPCPFLATSMRGYILVIHSMDERICKPIDLDIWVNDPAGSRCLVGSIQKLTPEQVAGLKKRDRP